MKDEEVKIIAINVAAGIGNHGDFLRSFFESVQRADGENFIILKAPAVQLIEKYKLDADRYLSIN